ncbi:MAG: Calx-beta domain-containing protein, partial [Hydrogenophilales bacterium]|nr:Calx-beta domain-containing protein [Hydrogenophilales bacterium]
NIAVLGNAIYGNSGLGIDLGDDGLTLNDADDVDAGANGLQNFPVLTSAVSSGGNTTVAGTLNSTVGTNFRIEFFSSPAADASGHGEGQTYLGFADVTTDGSGNASFNTVLAGVSVTVGHVISATATVDLGVVGYGATSEFCPRM